MCACWNSSTFPLSLLLLNLQMFFHFLPNIHFHMSFSACYEAKQFQRSGFTSLFHTDIHYAGSHLPSYPKDKPSLRTAGSPLLYHPAPRCKTTASWCATVIRQTSLLSLTLLCPMLSMHCILNYLDKQGE